MMSNTGGEEIDNLKMIDWLLSQDERCSGKGFKYAVTEKMHS